MAATPYHLDLLAPYLSLPQGESIQAECVYRRPFYLFVL
jgi:hypothetical protein